MKIPKNITHCLVCNAPVYVAKTCICNKFELNYDKIWYLINNLIGISIYRYGTYAVFYLDNRSLEVSLDEYDSFQELIDHYNKLVIFS